MINQSLLKKYDVPAPRYTSYPTVPYWEDNPSSEEWLDSLHRGLAPKETSWALYIHIPFCETLCTFCGCNTSITKNHQLEIPYVGHVLKEWQIYKERVPQLMERKLRHVHLGGGTPTFLSAENLDALLRPLLKDCVGVDDPGFEGSIEVDPRRTNKEQLAALRELGFNRISLGVQDFTEEVQRIVNRIQPREMTERVLREARELGYGSANFDLIYGLPKQTPESVRFMTEVTAEMRPDRIALYSFARVPWIKPQQRLFKDEDIPEGDEKRALYEIAREILLKAGYQEIGMDHFALPEEGLARAEREGRLHRNFMGYTDQRTDVLLGLGVSSISESPDCFHQNEKLLPKYEKSILEGKIATLRGHKLNKEDLMVREQILRLMTRWELEIRNEEQERDLKEALGVMLEDGLIEINVGVLRVRDEGRPFLRNVCMAFDQRMRRSKPEAQVFSQSL